MRSISRLAALTVLTLALAAVQWGPAWAHGPTRKKVTEKIAINAPPEKVWDAIKDFHDFNWHPRITDTSGDGGNEENASRTITFKDGGTVKEQLEHYKPDQMSYSIFVPHIDTKVLPVTNYSSKISVKAADGGGSEVEWRAAFYRGDPNGEPPPELSDEAAVKAITAFVKEGLQGLKAKVEGAS